MISGSLTGKRQITHIWAWAYSHTFYKWGLTVRVMVKRGGHCAYK